MRVAAVQMSTSPDDRPANLRRAEAHVARAVAAGAELVVLPELFDTGYCYELSARTSAESLEGAAGSWLGRMARRHRVWLAGCVYERNEAGCFDAFVLQGPEGQRAVHRKRVPVGPERFFFEPGDDPMVVETPLGRVALVICAESEHAALLAEVVRARPRIVLIVYAAPTRHRLLEQLLGVAYREHLRRLQLQWARCSGAPVVSASMTGPWRSGLPGIPGLKVRSRFQGQSAIVDARGQILASLDREEGVLGAELDLGEPRPIDPVPSGPWVGRPIRGWARGALSLVGRCGARSYDAWQRRKRAAE